MRTTVKLLTTLSVILVSITLAYSQEQTEEHNNVLDSPEGWGLEVMTFPLGFAREIDYQGFEEIWFAPGWKDVGSQEFWAYAFVWYLDAGAEMTSEKLTDQMEAYFNGIQEVSNSNAVFIELNDGSYVGSIRTFDKFTTKKEFVLNVKMRSQYCSKTNKYTYLFHIVPLPFDHQVWSSLERVKLSEDCN